MNILRHKRISTCEHAEEKNGTNSTIFFSSSISAAVISNCAVAVYKITVHVRRHSHTNPMQTKTNKVNNLEFAHLLQIVSNDQSQSAPANIEIHREICV